MKIKIISNMLACLFIESERLTYDKKSLCRFVAHSRCRILSCRRRAGNDFDNFLRNRRLTNAVHIQSQSVNEFARVF